MQKTVQLYLRIAFCAGSTSARLDTLRAIATTSAGPGRRRASRTITVRAVRKSRGHGILTARANTQLIWSGGVFYLYNPTFGYVLTGNMNLNDQIYMRPRLSDTINRVNS